MSDRLDRIEAIVESNARTVSALTDRMATLLTAIDESNERFKVLRLEAQRDREEFRQSWNDAVAQMEKDRTEAKAQADADRADARKQFEAHQQIIQRLLLELVEVNRDSRRLEGRITQLEQRRPEAS